MYRNRARAPENLRDLFIRTVRHPIDSILREADRISVLNEVNFEIRRGQRVALIGVNGAGKTSLCRILSGVMRPTRGHVIRPKETRAVFQAPLVLYPELTGFENAELLTGLMYPELDGRAVRTLAEEATAFAELGEAAYTPYRTYSTGMQARLILSVVTAKAADFLILDEVFEGADMFWQKKIQARTRNLIEKAGAFLFVSHNSELLREVCHRSIVLKNGRAHCFESVDDGLKFYTS